MTREKAIGILKAMWISEKCGYSDKMIREALNMAIKALDYYSCEDAISRKTLIEQINHAEENFKANNMEIIASGGDSFVDGVLSGVFNIREMVIQAQSIYKAESEVSDGDSN